MSTYQTNYINPAVIEIVDYNEALIFEDDALLP
jgi:hypothetical protein